MEKNIASKTKSSLLWNTSFRIGYQAFRFVISIVIARILEPKDFGLMGIATLMIFYANSLSEFGFSQALIQKGKINKNLINSVFTINFSVSLCLAVGLIFLSPCIAEFFSLPPLKNVLFVLSPIFVITSFYNLPMTLMKRQINFKVVVLADLCRGICQSVITLVLALMGFHYWSLVIGLLTAYVVATFYIMFKVKCVPKIEYHHNEMKEIYSFGMWNFMRAQISHISDYTDKFIIGKFLGPASLAFYEKAHSTVDMQRQSFTRPFNSVMFASFSRIQSGESEQIRNFFKKSVMLISLSTFPINVCIFLLSTHFVMILLGSKWEQMINPLQIFSVAFVFVPLNGLIASLNIGMGKYRIQAIRESICAVLFVIICFLFVKKGINFVAYGYGIISFLRFIITFYVAWKNANMRFVDIIECFRPAVIGSLVMFLVMSLSGKYLFLNINILNFVFLSGIGLFAYILTVFLPKYVILESDQAQIVSHCKNILNKCFCFLK